MSVLFSPYSPGHIWVESLKLNEPSRAGGAFWVSLPPGENRLGPIFTVCWQNWPPLLRCWESWGLACREHQSGCKSLHFWARTRGSLMEYWDAESADTSMWVLLESVFFNIYRTDGHCPLSATWERLCENHILPHCENSCKARDSSYTSSALAGKTLSWQAVLCDLAMITHLPSPSHAFFESCDQEFSPRSTFWVLLAFCSFFSMYQINVRKI